MTYCVAMRLNSGIVFLSDSRTNAGVDHIGTFRKMHVFEQPGERVLVLMSAGNLAISQSIRQALMKRKTDSGYDIWNAPTMFEVARVLGEVIRDVHKSDGEALAQFGIDFNCSMILGGQIRGEGCRLFQLYSAGNFIEATEENLYFQIGEAKYGKPIIDRVVSPKTSLDEASKAALISMDSTLRSNLSVGLPLDLLCYEADALKVTRFANIDNKNAYMSLIRNTWGARLQQVFSELPDPDWKDLAENKKAVNSVRIALTTTGEKKDAGSQT
jgi:putative proteasome-type protease